MEKKTSNLVEVRVHVEPEIAEAWTALAGGRNHRGAYVTNLIKVAADLPALVHSCLKPGMSFPRADRGPIFYVKQD